MKHVYNRVGLFHMVINIQIIMPHVLLNVTEDEEEAVYQGGNFDSGNVCGVCNI